MFDKDLLHFGWVGNLPHTHLKVIKVNKGVLFKQKHFRIDLWDNDTECT